MRSVLWMVAAAILLIPAGLAKPKKRPAPHSAGRFDLYVLSLSWSPLYCADPQRANRDPEQCGAGRRFAFVTHGLWPNNDRAPHPRNCEEGSAVPKKLISRMLEIMPSPALIQHEWRAHGTCSGMNVNDYFAHVRAAYRLVQIPQRYQRPDTDLVVEAKTLREDFYRANGAIPPDAMRFDCSGRNLRELRVCLTKDLKPRACTSAVRDTCEGRAVTLLRAR